MAGAAAPRAGQLVRLRRHDRDGGARAGAAGEDRRPLRPRRTTRRSSPSPRRTRPRSSCSSSAIAASSTPARTPARRPLLHHQHRPCASERAGRRRRPLAPGAGARCSTRSSRTLTRNAPAGATSAAAASPSCSPVRARSTPAWAARSTRSTRCSASELDACDQLFAPHLGRSIRELMFGDADGADADLQQTLYTQPALFALEYAAARALDVVGREAERADRTQHRRNRRRDAGRAVHAGRRDEARRRRARA